MSNIYLKDYSNYKNDIISCHCYQILTAQQSDRIAKTFLEYFLFKKLNLFK